MFVQPAPDPNPIGPALLEAARVAGIPTFDSPNGRMMEGNGGCALIDMRVQDGRRLSVFRSYAYPCMASPNLTVLTGTLATRIIFEGKRAIGIEVVHHDVVHRFGAAVEIVLSAGAIQTPKLLMQSGIGDAADLKRVGIVPIEHIPGVGKNLQDHIGPASCMWEYEKALAPRNNGAEATFFWKSDSKLDTPDMQVIQGEVPFASAEAVAQFHPPAGSWILWPGLVRPLSRGYLQLTGPDPTQDLEIYANTLAHPDDMTAILRCVELCRQIGSSSALKPFVKREVMPGRLGDADLRNFVRNATITVWHQAGTAKMGHDSLSVVDSQLKVYGVEKLRIADASIMPRVTTGNTMAPCVIIGEKAGEMLRSESLRPSSRIRVTDYRSS